MATNIGRGLKRKQLVEEDGGPAAGVVASTSADTRLHGMSSTSTSTCTKGKGARKEREEIDDTNMTHQEESSSRHELLVDQDFNDQTQAKDLISPLIFSNDKQDDAPVSLHLPGPIEQVCLEAIFYPKFENELQSDSIIRNKMKEKVAAGQGYLEVTVKHSGSLLLWSGGERFYSKNSTMNVFTAAGETLLRQHFVRAFWNDDDPSTATTTTQDKPPLLSRMLQLQQEQAYRKCSDYVEKHRLTLSFEVVTSFLGHHGDIPNRDYLILTAVADRQAERFFSTTELVELAHRFRLPHNDAWVFASLAHVEDLFTFYDSYRETGTASSVVSALTQSADVCCVSSMYPHVNFQGEIMEGIVIRYVPCNDRKHALEHVTSLAQTAHELLVNHVPPDLPDAPKLIQTTTVTTMNNNNNNSNNRYDEFPPVLKTDLRVLFENNHDTFENALRNLLLQSGSSRHIDRLSKKDIGDVPSLLRPISLTPKASDRESHRIAHLVQTLSALNDRVDYSIVRELNETRDQEARWLCIVHILFDKTFQKYRRHATESSMELYRGFVFEINPSRKPIKGNLDRTHEASARQCREKEEPLMLKMKFLPYMVRTFGCRNGLKKVRNGGHEAFFQHATGMLSKWNISIAGRTEWLPFFEAWGKYAEACYNGQHADLPPLCESNYLTHLERFDELFSKGEYAQQKQESASQCLLQGLVVVVSPRLETSSLVADYIANQVGGARRVNRVETLTKTLVENACMPGGGIVCSTTGEKGNNSLRKLVKVLGDSISLVLFQMSNEDIDEIIPESDPARRGILRSWQKTRCKLYRLPFESLFETKADSLADCRPNHDFSAMISERLKASRGADAQQPGLLLFFPGIPGCGKSSLMEGTTQQTIQKKLSEIQKDHPDKSERKLEIFVGDKIKEKFWSKVTLGRLKDSSGVTIADKNAPNFTSWKTVGALCAKTRAFGVPVLPDQLALQTTEVRGTQNKSDDRKHVYPFSLAYLAVCLSRVLERPAGSHDGKLDSGTKRASLIVIMFYTLYRDISAEMILDQIESAVTNEGALLFEPIRVPFFKSDGAAQRIQLPHSLEQALVEALRVQVSHLLYAIRTHELG